MARRDALQRGTRLLLTLLAYAATGFPPGRAPALAGLLREWLDTWSGVGRIIEAMGRTGFDIQLTRYGDHGWRATFYPAGREHSPTHAAGTAWQATPGRAIQVAALHTLIRADAG